MPKPGEAYGKEGAVVFPAKAVPSQHLKHAFSQKSFSAYNHDLVSLNMKSKLDYRSIKHSLTKNGSRKKLLPPQGAVRPMNDEKILPYV